MDSTTELDTVNKLREDLNRLLLRAGEEIETKPLRTTSQIKNELLELYETYQPPWMTMVQYSEYLRENILNLQTVAEEQRQRGIALGPEEQQQFNEAEYWKKKHKFVFSLFA